MNSIKARARRTGALYLLLTVMAPFNLIYVPRAFIVPGDAAATAHNIIAGELTYRLGIFIGLATSVVFLLLALSLYDLLKDVDRKQARLMVMLVAVSVAVGVVNLVNQIAPLVLLTGADFLSEFTRPQLDALALGFLGLQRGVTHLDMAFWGLWLFPFGALVIKSGFFPRVLGVLLIVAGCAYLLLSFVSIVLPAGRPAVFNVTLPFYAAGELAMILWLLVKGAKAPDPPVTQPAVTR